MHSHSSVTNVSGAHIRFRGSEIAMSANTTQIYGRRARPPIYCCNLPSG